jgi:transcriptional regulator with XRE-family HTH domain
MAAIAPRLRQLRVQSGLSQKEVGIKLGISGQQVQKYENGTDAVSLHRLLKLASLYKVPPESFWNGYTSPPALEVPSEVDEPIFQLVRAFKKIKNPSTKQRLLELVREMANADAKQDRKNMPIDR